MIAKSESEAMTYLGWQMNLRDFCWLGIAFLLWHGESMSWAAEPASAGDLRWLVRVDPVDLGKRDRDEMPAEVALEIKQDGTINTTTLRVIRVDESGKPLSTNGGSQDSESLPFRWYDDAIPYDFPEFQDSVSRTAGRLHPQPRERGGYYLNAMGDGRKGRLAWMHTQVGKQAAWYSIEARLLRPGESPRHLPPQGWIGDGQARCAIVATQAVHSDHLRIDLDDWNNDGLIDLIVGDDFGHIVWWPNLGTRKLPKFEYCRLILDTERGNLSTLERLPLRRCAIGTGTATATWICSSAPNVIGWFGMKMPARIATVS